MDPELFVQQHEKAAGKAGTVELRIRLLANVTKPIEAKAYSQYYGEIMDAILSHFDPYLTEPEKVVLNKTKQLRNKVLHAELKQMADLSELPLAPVKHIKIDSNISGGDLLNLLQGDHSAAPNVGDLSFKQAGVAGWLLTNGLSGVFVECYNVFSEADAILNRIFDMKKSPETWDIFN